MAKVRYAKPKPDPDIKRCTKCDCVLAYWEAPYGGLCHLCADDYLMERRLP